MIISIIIATQVKYFLYLISGIKFFVMFYFCIDKVYYGKSQYYRGAIINILHFVLFALFTITKVYLE